MSPKVLVVNLSTSGSKLGGAAIAAEWHSRFMASKISIELWRMWDYDAQSHIGDLTIREFCSKVPFKVINLFPKSVRSLFLDSDILDHITSYMPNIIHLQNPLPPLAFQRIVHFASKLGIKIVVSTHGFYEIMNPDMCRKFHEVYLWKRAVQPVIRSSRYVDAVLSGYPEEKVLLRKMGYSEKKIYLVHNGVNPFFLDTPSEDEYIDVFQSFNINPELPILLFVGNHVFKKGLNTVLEIASKISKPVCFVIGGKLTDKDEPQRMLSKYPPKQDVNVIFTDFLSLPAQRALYYAASMLLFPSLGETLPLAIIEAMSCGLPVIAYGVGGVPFQFGKGFWNSCFSW